MKQLFLMCFSLIVLQTVWAKELYFPPVNNTLIWDKTTPEALNWKTENIDSLYRFLETENSKAFIVLKDGKIVLEKYFGDFTADSLWYWASAGKTITSFLIGKAQEESYLKIEDPVSKYLGLGWTACNASQENAITIRHQLTMTTGLDDGVADNHCTSAQCLVYKADPGDRWAYHNAPYTLLENVIEQATSTSINLYTHSKLKTKTGMNGAWVTLGYDNVYYSNARSMARFGLLMQNNCVWNNDTLLHDSVYLKASLNSSQAINKSYGYLWWLNGKGSYMLPTLQFVFQGNYAPDAPDDMYAALGKNGQIISVSPSQGLVIVRMGNVPNSPAADIAPQLCNQIWKKLNAITDYKTHVSTQMLLNNIKLFPTIVDDIFTLSFDRKADKVLIYNSNGVLMDLQTELSGSYSHNVKSYARGVYLVITVTNNQITRNYFLKR